MDGKSFILQRLLQVFQCERACTNGQSGNGKRRWRTTINQKSPASLLVMQKKGNVKWTGSYAKGRISSRNGYQRPNASFSWATPQLIDPCLENWKKAFEHASLKSVLRRSDVKSFTCESFAEWGLEQAEQESEKPERTSRICEEKLGWHPRSWSK